MLRPKVSIIIPYNKDRGWLNEAIDSAQRQSYKGEIEIILSQSDNRVGYNINRGIEESSGEFIKFFAEDDLLTWNCVEASVDAIKDYDFIHGRAIEFHTNGFEKLFTPRMSKPKLNNMLESNMLHGGTLFYRRDVFDRFGMFNEELWTGEEYEFNLRLLSQGANIGYCNDILFRYRRHINQKSLGNIAKEYQLKRSIEIDRIKSMYR